MNEVELREMLGSELFDRLSQDDKKLILTNDWKLDFSKYKAAAEIPNKPCFPQPFYVIDKELGEVIAHPIDEPHITDITEDDVIYIKPESTFFALDCYGELLIFDSLGDWTATPERYTYVFNKDYWSSFEVKNENNR